MERLFIRSVLLGTIIFIVWVYVFQAADASEDQLVQTSYLWIPLLTFSLVGLLVLGKNNASQNSGKTMLATGIGLLAGVGMYLLLLVFYEVIWPGL